MTVRRGTIGAVLLALPLAVAATASPVERPTPGVALITLPNETRIAHHRADPLLVYVRLYNGAAGLVREVNERNREEAGRLEASDWLQGLPERERRAVLADLAPAEVPVFRLGAPEAPVVSLVEVRLADPAGHPAATLRPLARARSLEASITLEGDDVVLLPFGADGSDLSRLPEGSYRLKAVLDTRGSPSGWQGVTASREVTVHLVEPTPAPAPHEDRRRLHRVARFHLEDRQLDRALTSAELLTARHPESANGWVLLGDVRAALGHDAEALAAYRKAMEVFRDLMRLDPPPVLEPPDDLQRKIRKVEARLEEGS